MAPTKSLPEGPVASLGFLSKRDDPPDRAIREGDRSKSDERTRPGALLRLLRNYPSNVYIVIGVEAGKEQ